MVPEIAVLLLQLQATPLVATPPVRAELTCAALAVDLKALERQRSAAAHMRQDLAVANDSILTWSTGEVSNSGFDFALTIFDVNKKHIELLDKIIADQTEVISTLPSITGALCRTFIPGAGQ